MVEFKVGDRVRLTGGDWANYEGAGVYPGAIVEITEIDINGIWAGEVGTVGNRQGLYSESNPERSGDYSCELVSGNPEEELLGDSSFEQSVRYHTNKIADLLISKNKQYSNSALDPIRIFSKADRTEQLRIRADDKLSRIRNGDKSEDAVLDLCGYLILLRIAAESE